MKPRLSESVEIVVPFHDLDPVNIVWHGHYAKYMEIAREALMRGVGFSHAEMMATGYAWPVVEMKLRYVQPARLGQRLRVTATLLEYDPRLKITYEIADATTGRKLTRATTVQVPVKMPEGKLLYEIPEVFRVPMERALLRLTGTCQGASSDASVGPSLTPNPAPGGRGALLPSPSGSGTEGEGTPAHDRRSQ
jgi:acyl-CoA thioester hydrolase